MLHVVATINPAKCCFDFKVVKVNQLQSYTIGLRPHRWSNGITLR